MRRKVISCAALLCCTLALISCGGGGGGSNGIDASKAVADQYDVASTSLSVGAPGVLTNDSLVGAVSIVSYTQGSHGSVTLNNDGGFTYQPTEANYSGPDSFSYTIRDALDRESTAQVNLMVTSSNSPHPVAEADSYTVAADTTLSVERPGVLENDSLHGAIDIASYTQGVHGIVTLNNDGSFTYQPNAGYSGTDSFSYTIRNSAGNESTAQVNLNVTAPGSSSEKIAEAVDLSQAQIAKYKDKKLAAASYTFDDALSTQFEIANYFEEVGLRASFFLVPKNIPDSDWQYWRELAVIGHELGNHSMSHGEKELLLSNPNLTDEYIDNEINGAQRLIAEKTGFTPLAFVFPSGEYNERSLSIAKQNHIVTRKPGFDGDYEEFPIGGSSITAADQANAALTNALNAGKWIVFAGHGIVNGGQKGEGYDPIAPQVLHDHVLFAGTQSANIWIDTFIKVARYRLCREQAQPQTELVSSNLAIVRFGGNYSGYCTEPLTVVLPITKWPAAGFYARTASGENVPFAWFGDSSGDSLLLNVIPGKEVLLSIAQ